jgi:hypothetical protein
MDVFRMGRKRRQHAPHGPLALKIDLLVFECLYEALDMRVVAPIPRAGHRPHESSFLKAFPMPARGVLGATVLVMDAAKERAAALEGGLQGSQRQSCLKDAARSVAHNVSGPSIRNDRRNGRLTTDLKVGQVLDPELIQSHGVIPARRFSYQPVPASCVLVPFQRVHHGGEWAAAREGRAAPASCCYVFR